MYGEANGQLPMSFFRHVFLDTRSITGMDTPTRQDLLCSETWEAASLCLPCDRVPSVPRHAGIAGDILAQWVQELGL